MVIKTSESHYYVTIQQEQPFLGMARIVSTPTGKKRIKTDGTVEAEFFCLSPRSACQTIWATKDQIVIPTT